MALTQRQTLAYKDTVSVYRITTYEKDSSASVKQPAYSSSPTYSGIKCRIQTTVFRNSFVNPLGRSQLDNFETEDRLHTDIIYDIRDGDVVVVETVGSPALGKAYKVIGKGEARIVAGQRTPNYNHVRIRLLDVKPRNIA